MRLATLSALLLAAATRVFAADESDVLNLTSANFDSTVDPADLILVEFFAPWCGHCKSLAPRYEEAAASLKTKNIPLAKVDCVDQDELCKKHRVSGYPTLKVFKKGKPADYNGPRTTEGIVTYMIKQSLPSVNPVTKDTHDEFTKGDKVVVMLYASEVPASYSQYAETHRDDYLFGHAVDPAVAEAAGVSQPAIVVYRSFDDPRIDYSGDVSNVNEETFGTWIKANAVPLLDEVNGDTYKTYAESGLPLAYVFIDPLFEGKEEIIQSFKPVAKEHKGKINFAWIDANRFNEHAKAMNLKKFKWPAFVIQDISKQLKYPLSQDINATPETVGPFVKDYLAGKLEPSLRSEEIPASQDGGVFVLVTKQFDEVVFDDSKDVFVEFYAPWCGHCKRLAPIWESLGEKYAPVKDKLVIAKMDATENDIPPSAPFRISGFPTLKFKPAGSRSFIDYDGDRTLESLTEFVEKHAKNKIELPASSETASSETSAVPEGEKHAQQHVEL